MTQRPATSTPASIARAAAAIEAAASLDKSDITPLLDSVTDLVIVVSGDRIAYINRAGCEFLGAAGGNDILGEPLDKFLDPRLVYAPLLRKHEAGQNETDLWVRVPLRRVDGNSVEADVRPVLIAERKALAIIGRRTGMVELLDPDAPAAALHAADGLKQLIANMAHELRTPLNAIIGFSEIIAERMFGDINDRYVAYASDILASGQHLLRIINDILDYAKVESGESLLRLEKAPVNDVIRAGLRLVTGQAEQSGLQVVDELTDVLPLIHIDGTKVKQIVVNLMTNAIKFTPRGGRISIGSRAIDGKTIEVWIRDTGIGMTQAEAAEALLPFRQPKRPPDGSYAGTGLGLSIAKALVALHGGELRITSTPNEGTEVRFRLLNQSSPDRDMATG
jgi:signal transduction histidine kinase